MSIRSVRQRVLLYVTAAFLALTLAGVSGSFAPVLADGGGSGSCPNGVCGD